MSYYSNPVIYVTADGQYRAGTNVLDLPGVRSWLPSATNKSPGAALAIRADERAPYASVQALLELYKELGLRRNFRTTPFQSGRPKFGTNPFDTALATKRQQRRKRGPGIQTRGSGAIVIEPQHRGCHGSARQALIANSIRSVSIGFRVTASRWRMSFLGLAIETRELDPDKRVLTSCIGPEQNARPGSISSD